MKTITIKVPDDYFKGIPDTVIFGEGSYGTNKYGKFEKGRRLLMRALKSVLDINKIIPEYEAEFKLYAEQKKQIYRLKERIRNLTRTNVFQVQTPIEFTQIKNKIKSLEFVLKSEEEKLKELEPLKEKFERWSNTKKTYMYWW